MPHARLILLRILPYTHTFTCADGSFTFTRTFLLLGQIWISRLRLRISLVLCVVFTFGSLVTFTFCAFTVTLILTLRILFTFCHDLYIPFLLLHALHTRVPHARTTAYVYAHARAGFYFYARFPTHHTTHTHYAHAHARTRCTVAAYARLRSGFAATRLYRSGFATRVAFTLLQFAFSSLLSGCLAVASLLGLHARICSLCLSLGPQFARIPFAFGFSFTVCRTRVTHALHLCYTLRLPRLDLVAPPYTPYRVATVLRVRLLRTRLVTRLFTRILQLPAGYLCAPRARTGYLAHLPPRLDLHLGLLRTRTVVAARSSPLLPGCVHHTRSLMDLSLVLSVCPCGLHCTFTHGSPRVGSLRCYGLVAAALHAFAPHVCARFVATRARDLFGLYALRLVCCCLSLSPLYRSPHARFCLVARSGSSPLSFARYATACRVACTLPHRTRAALPACISRARGLPLHLYSALGSAHAVTTTARALPVGSRCCAVTHHCATRILRFTFHLRFAHVLPRGTAHTAARATTPLVARILWLTLLPGSGYAHRAYVPRLPAVPLPSACRILPAIFPLPYRCPILAGFSRSHVCCTLLDSLCAFHSLVRLCFTRCPLRTFCAHTLRYLLDCRAVAPHFALPRCWLDRLRSRCAFSLSFDLRVAFYVYAHLHTRFTHVCRILLPRGSRHSLARGYAFTCTRTRICVFPYLPVVAAISGSSPLVTFTFTRSLSSCVYTRVCLRARLRYRCARCTRLVRLHLWISFTLRVCTHLPHVYAVRCAHALRVAFGFCVLS